MATEYTPNYNLGKQTDFTDKFDMSVINENADIIDNALKKHDTKLSESEEKLTAALSENAAETSKNRATIGYEMVNFLKNTAASRERNGVTATVNADGSITLNGTNSGSTTMLFSNLQTGATPEGSQFTNQFTNNKKWIPTGRYIMSLGADVSGVTLQTRLSAVANSEGNYVSCGASDAILTVTDDDLYVWTRILIGAGASFSNATIYPMIRPDYVSDGTYRPYRASVEERLAAIEAALTAATATEAEV